MFVCMCVCVCARDRCTAARKLLLTEKEIVSCRATLNEIEEGHHVGISWGGGGGRIG